MVNGSNGLMGGEGKDSGLGECRSSMSFTLSTDGTLRPLADDEMDEDLPRAVIPIHLVKGTSGIQVKRVVAEEGGDNTIELQIGRCAEMTRDEFPGFVFGHFFFHLTHHFNIQN